jgi:hypothetical protein
MARSKQYCRRSSLPASSLQIVEAALLGLHDVDQHAHRGDRQARLLRFHRGHHDVLDDGGTFGGISLPPLAHGPADEKQVSRPDLGTLPRTRRVADGTDRD